MQPEDILLFLRCKMNDYKREYYLKTQELKRENILKCLLQKPLSEVARENNVSRQTIYNWRKQLCNEGNLRPKRRGGSKKKTVIIPEEEIKQIIKGYTPSDFGYKSKLWTVPLAKKMIHSKYNIHISIFKLTQFLFNWQLYPTCCFFNYPIYTMFPYSDLKALYRLSLETKQQVYLIGAIQQEDGSGTCFYSLTLKRYLKFMYTTEESASKNKIFVSMEFLNLLYETARKKIIVVYENNLTTKHLRIWRKTKAASRIQVIGGYQINEYCNLLERSH